MHLVDPLGPRALRRVVKDLAGIQAQLASAGALQCQVRARGLTAAAIEKALYEKKHLIKAWAMRGTLHWIDADDFPTWAAALSTRVQWSEGRLEYWKKEYGLAPEDLEPAIETVLEVLDGRCMTRADMADEVKKKRPNDAIDERIRSGWGEILRLVSSRRGLCFGPNQGRNVTFALADQWVPGFEERDPDESIRAVLLRYLATHAPATREEFARWWGFKPADARRAIDAAGDKLAPVTRDGRTAYVLKKDLRVLLDAAEDDAVRMLPMFDAYTLAGLPHEAIVPKAKKSLVYRTGAWVWPTVLRGGVIVGVWNVDKKTRRVEVELFRRGSVSKKQVAEAFAVVEPYLVGAGPLSFT